MFDEQYLEKFNAFLTNEKFNGTQKFVFLKSLFYLAGDKHGVPYEWSDGLVEDDGQILKVNLKFIAISYTKYYWDMFYRFRLRQSATGNQYYTCQNCKEKQAIPYFEIGKHNCKKCNSTRLENEYTDINIHKNFVDAQGEPIKPPKSLGDLVSNYAHVIKNVVYGDAKKPLKPSLNEPLKALNEKGFYKKRDKITSKDDPLEFDIRVIDFFKKYGIILNSAINYELTKYLEKINKYFPQVAKAVLIDIPRQNLPKKERAEYDKLYKNSDFFTCFYCNVKFGIKEQARDHVIPFDYVLSENLYNSVPSCKTCNSKKSNLLPCTEILEEVILRNKNLENKVDYSEKEFEKLYRNCKENYHGNRRCFKFQYSYQKNKL